MKYFSLGFIIFLLVLSFSCLPGCTTNPYPTKVYYEIHDAPVPKMKIINRPDGTQAIVEDRNS